jgi:hypothetical protein
MVSGKNPWETIIQDLLRLYTRDAKKVTSHRKGHGRGRKSSRAKKPKPKHWHNQPHTGEQHPTTAGDPWKSAHAPSGGEMPMVELTADHSIGGVLLELAGEGKIGLATALHAWQRDQERITNRVWRRPGGLQRMGGL